jgi:hypothetical protein
MATEHNLFDEGPTHEQLHGGVVGHQMFDGAHRDWEEEFAQGAWGEATALKETFRKAPNL